MNEKKAIPLNEENFDKEWANLQVGDFIMEYWGDVQTSRGQKVLAKHDDNEERGAALFSFCEDGGDASERVCGMKWKHEWSATVAHRMRKDPDHPILLFKNPLTQKTMKVTNLVKKILDKDTRTLVEAGFINGGLTLTDEGIEELMGLLFLENKEALVKIAKEKLNEDSK